MSDPVLSQAKADAATLRSMYERKLSARGFWTVPDHYRHSQCFEYGIASFHPVVHKHLADAVRSACCGSVRVFDATDVNRCKPALVLTLLDGRRPTAIIWRIIAIGIQAVNRMLRAWPLAHVGEEVLKRVQPSVTNFDSACAIKAESLRRWTVASLFHSDPSEIFGPAAHTMCAAFHRCLGVKRCIRADHSAVLNRKAPTRTSGPSREVREFYSLCVAAITKAIEKIPTIRRRQRTPAQYKQPSESLAGHVAECAHG